MKQMNEEDLINLLENGALESQMFNTFYGLAPINKKILQERVKLKFMKSLTQSEMETLKEAEDILFSHLDDELEGVFSDSAIALHIAIKNYTKSIFKDAKPEHKKAIENYAKKWYNKK